MWMGLNLQRQISEMQQTVLLSWQNLVFMMLHSGYKLLAVKGAYVNVGVDVSETENGKVAKLIPDWGVWCVSDKVFGFMRHEVSDVKITL